jgi:hypothetical protein
VDERVVVARQQWNDAFREIAPGRPPAVDEHVVEQIEVVTEELRRRIGGSFTLAELADVYDGAERWALHAIASRSSGQTWVRTASTATDAAFHLYARGARDFQP